MAGSQGAASTAWRRVVALEEGLLAEGEQIGRQQARHATSQGTREKPTSATGSRGRRLSMSTPHRGIQWCNQWRTGRVARLACVVCLACCAVLLPTALAGCGSGGGVSASLTTDTRSAQLATDAEKIAFLRRYVKLSSAVEATEFHIVYHDNAGGRVPGPSDWDIRVALKVAPADVPAWTGGLQERAAAGVDLSWAITL